MLFYGPTGVGKSCASVSVVGSVPKSINYLAADRPVASVLELYPEAEPFTFERPIHDYKGVRTAIQDTLLLIKGTNPLDHWVIADTLGHMYRMVQEDFSMSTYGKELEDLKMERLKLARGKGDAKEYGIDGLNTAEWRAIVATFDREVFRPLRTELGCNVIFICHETPTKGWYGEKNMIESMDRFREIGFVPDTHRTVPGFMETILHFTFAGGKRYFETAKESGTRKHFLAPEEYNRFWSDYISKV